MPSISEVAARYKRTQIQTAAAPRIICMLHNRCANLIQKAIDSGDKPDRKIITQAQNILAQLERSLIIEDDLSKSLFYLYDYCYCRIESGETDKLKSALSVISPIKDAFEQLLKPS